MTTTNIYLCDDTLESIFSCIYLAWKDGTGHTDIRIKSTYYASSLFERYIDTTLDSFPYDKSLSDKVIKAIKNKLGNDVYLYVYNVCLSADDNKPSYIYHFLQKAFKYGPSILNRLNDDDVKRIYSLSRYVENEAHRYLGFVRFEENNNSVLISRIDPVNNIIPKIAPHFNDRFSCENWIILDTKRLIAAVHSAHHGYYLTYSINNTMLNKVLNYSDNEYNFKSLWNTFFKTISIEERSNYKLQRNNMPLRYRHYMDMDK